MTEGGMIMADWDKELPPIIKERLTTIGDVNPKEKQEMRELDGLHFSILEGSGKK